MLGRKRGGKQRAHEFMYWETKVNRAVRMGDWKLVLPESGAPVELYDLKTDISESRDVASEHPDVVAKMSGYMNASHTAPPPQIEPQAPDGRQYR